MKDRINSVLLHKPWMRHMYDDTLGIATRLRMIDDGYFILFNTMSGKFEVHNTYNGDKNTYCFTVPFNALDARTIDHCQKTRIENSDKLIKQMEEDNKKIDETRLKDFHNTAEAASRETAYDVSLAIQKDELNEGYKRTHQVLTPVQEMGIDGGIL